MNGTGTHFVKAFAGKGEGTYLNELGYGRVIPHVSANGADIVSALFPPNNILPDANTIAGTADIELVKNDNSICFSSFPIFGTFGPSAPRETTSPENCRKMKFWYSRKQRSGGRPACMPDIFPVTRKANLYGVASYLAYRVIRVQGKSGHNFGQT